MICPICKTETETIFKSGVVNGKYISKRCQICFGLVKIGRIPSEHLVEYNRDRQREDMRKDILQPFINNKPNREFAHAYKNKAKDYYSDKELNDL
jgi:hypothetical protein